MIFTFERERDSKSEQMMALLNLLSGVFECNHMYNIKDFFAIHVFVQVHFYVLGLFCCRVKCRFKTTAGDMNYGELMSCSWRRSNYS